MIGLASLDAGIDGVARPTARRSAPELSLGLRRGARRRCPACGVGPLFQGYLSVRPICPACWNDNEQYPADDAAPYVTIFVVAHVLVPILFVIDRAGQFSVATELIAALPVFSAATLALLPYTKGSVIGVAWAFGVIRALPAGREGEP